MKTIGSTRDEAGTVENFVYENMQCAYGADNTTPHAREWVHCNAARLIDGPGVFCWPHMRHFIAQFVTLACSSVPYQKNIAFFL